MSYLCKQIGVRYNMVAFIVIGIVIIAFIALAAIMSSRTKTPTTTNAVSTHDEQYLMRLMQAKKIAEERGDKEAVQAILEMRYDELLIERAKKKKDLADIQVKVPTRSIKIPTQDRIIAIYNIAGINFRKNIQYYVGESRGYIKPQPTNQYDPKAIAIYASDGHHLGYIPANETDEVRALKMPFPIKVSVFIDERYDDCENRNFFYGEIHIKSNK